VSNPNKARGDRFEMDVRDHLAAAGFDVERTRAGYERDYGDLHVMSGDAEYRKPAVIVQAKNHRAHALGEWLTHTALQREHAGARHGVLVVKRRGVGAAGRQYAVMELDDLLALLREAGYANGETS
jgi:hypothetical protein